MTIKKELLFLLAILLLLATELAGQGMSARITGTIRNDDGKPLAGVLVTAVNTFNNSSLTAVSGEPDGSFRILGLTPGIYQASFDLEGYESYTAAGISLSVEQSVTLRIKLKRGTTSIAPAAATPPPTVAKTRFFDQRGKFSLQINLGANRMAVGAPNDYLDALNQSVAYVREPLDMIRWETDLRGEIGYRITPRLELAAGVGRMQGKRLRNQLTSVLPGTYHVNEDIMIDLKMRAIPIDLICRYWLGGKGGFLFGVFAAAQYTIANWEMESLHSLSRPLLPSYTTRETKLVQSASKKGLGWAAGGRVEAKLDEHYSFIMELSGRWAPLRHFTGRQTLQDWSHYDWSKFNRSDYWAYEGEISDTEGELWSYESYNAKLGRWQRSLSIGARPEGADVRNVSSANIDFSGLCLRVGLLFHL